LNLEEILTYSEADLLPWAPVTRKNLAKGGLSISALAQAAQEMSDGVAANLLIKRLGGPAAVTAKFREMGDSVTRLDRYEPDLGLVLSADVRDTTTPLAYAQLVRRAHCKALLDTVTADFTSNRIEEANTKARLSRFKRLKLR
jgi:beta-lactamase class A